MPADEGEQLGLLVDIGRHFAFGGLGYKLSVIDEADELFDVLPAEFVKARDALAKRLAGAGRKDDAKAVKEMRRPSTSVWALNRVARCEPDEVEALLTAAESVREAQQKRSGDSLRDAKESLQRHVVKLARRAEELIVQEGVATSAPRREIEAALRDAASEGEAAETLRGGRLLQLPDEPDEMAMWSAGQDIAPEGQQPDEVDSRELSEARDNVDRAETEVRQAEELVSSLQRRVADLEATLEEERSALESAERVLKERAAALKKASAALARRER